MFKGTAEIDLLYETIIRETTVELDKSVIHPSQSVEMAEGNSKHTLIIGIKPSYEHQLNCCNS